jgi:hypothetical protein
MPLSPEEEEQARIAEHGTAMDLLGKRGIPPRQARKGAPPSEIGIEEQPDGWLRLTLTRPEAVDSGKLARALRAHLSGSRLTIRFDEARHATHQRIFQVRDLAGRGFTAAQIAEKLNLENAQSRGRERVAELKAAYGDLVRRLYLPALPQRR